MSDLTKLPEIGPVLAAHLIAVGIPDAKTLRQVGSHEAFLRIRAQRDPGACLHLLMALEAGTQGVRTTALTPAEKNDLKTWMHDIDDVSE